MGKRTIFFFLFIFVAVFVFWFFPPAEVFFNSLLEETSRIIAKDPMVGFFLFLVLSLFSAMITFFSSTLLVPFAINVWGEQMTFLLLWAGWFLGGMVSYGIARYFGRKAAGHFVSLEKINFYEDLLARNISFPIALTFKLALPSEIPSYFLGLIRYRFGKYLLVLLLSEAPFAYWTVYLGRAFLEGSHFGFIGWFLGGLFLIGILFLALHGKNIPWKHLGFQ